MEIPKLFIVICRSFSFELWADRVCLLECQKLYDTLASCFELCFSFQLKYPKECHTVAQIIQTRVCKYGDDSGTLTQMKRNVANDKLLKYLAVIGEIATN